MQACFGCFIEKLLVFSYLSSVLAADSLLKIWSILSAEWAVRTVADVHSEPIDRYPLSYFPLHLWAVIRRLDLRILFGGQTNANAVHALLEFIHRIGWDRLRFENTQRLYPYRGSGQEGSGATASVGDFICFELWSYHEIRRGEAEEYLV